MASRRRPIGTQARRQCQLDAVHRLVAAQAVVDAHGRDLFPPGHQQRLHVRAQIGFDHRLPRRRRDPHQIADRRAVNPRLGELALEATDVGMEFGQASVGALQRQGRVLAPGLGVFELGLGRGQGPPDGLVRQLHLPQGAGHADGVRGLTGVLSQAAVQVGQLCEGLLEQAPFVLERRHPACRAYGSGHRLDAGAQRSLLVRQVLLAVTQVLRAAGLTGVVRILVKGCDRPFLRRVGCLKGGLRPSVLALGAIEFARQRGDRVARLRHRIAQPLALVHGPQARIVRFRDPFPAHHVVLAADPAGLVDLLLGQPNHVAHLAELVEPQPELAHIRGPCLDQVITQGHAEIVHALELQRSLKGISERLRVRAIARRRQVLDQQAPGEVLPVRGEHGRAD